MNQFTASNGAEINPTGEGLMIILEGTYFAPNHVADALREFFRAEEDERLGRWRWPENPEYVVYHARNVNGDRKVLNETDGHGVLWGRDMNPAPRSSDMFECAARAYFDAHPEPKPWHRAMPGESWVLVYLNEEVPAVASSSESGHVIFTASTNEGGGTEEFFTDSKHITAGRRVYPEPS